MFISQLKSMLKFTDNPDSEDITEHSYLEDSNICMKASTRFQGMPIEIFKTINSIHCLMIIK